MSELKVDKVSPRTGNYVSLNTVGSKNIIINGDMSIAQRGTSTASITTTGYYTCDRWSVALTTLGTWTQSQSTDVPTGQGFAKSLKMDCTTADGSPGSNDLLRIDHKIEGQNLQYLKKGTANAQSLTLSFWIKATKTGTNIVELFDLDNSRQISKSYTVSSSDTWEKKTITFAGDTSGALDNDNANSLQLDFFFGAGSNYTSGTLNTSWNSNTTANRAVGQVNHADSASNNIYITGVQLEAGTTASDFEFLPFDTQLQRCKRYYQQTHPYGRLNDASLDKQDRSIHGMAWDDGNSTGGTWEVEMRSAPTVTFYGGDADGTGTSGNVFQGSDKTAVAGAVTTKKFGYIGVTSGRVTNYTRYAYVANAEL